MDASLALPADLDDAQRTHLANVAVNLQLVADLGYGVLDTAIVETAAYCLELMEDPRL